MKIIRRQVTDLVVSAPDLRPGFLNGSPIDEICVIQEVRTALSYAWDQANEALFGDGDFSRACDLLRSVLKDLFKITVRISGDTQAVAEGIEDLLTLLEGRLGRKDDSRSRRKQLIAAINKVKSKFKKLELRTAEPSPIRRMVKVLFGGDIKLRVPPEELERARTVARVVLRGVSDDLARRANIDESVRKALLAFGLNVWSTSEEYRTRRAEIFKRFHPDHGGDAEAFRRYHDQSKVLDSYFESIGVTPSGAATAPRQT